MPRNWRWLQRLLRIIIVEIAVSVLRFEFPFGTLGSDSTTYEISGVKDSTMASLQRCLLVNSLLLITAASASAADGPHWIWANGGRDAPNAVALRTSFQVSDEFHQVKLWLVNAYCDCEVFVDGESIRRIRAFHAPLAIDIRSLKAGKHQLGLLCRGIDGPSAVAARLIVNDNESVTNASWQASRLNASVANWQDLANADWNQAKSFGEIVERVWSSNGVATNVEDDYTQWKRALEQSGSTEAEQIEVQEGFQVERLYSAAEGEGSWISLAEDPQGRWVIGHEEQGLVRITLKDDNVAKAEKLAVTPKECRGLVFANDSLYVMGNKSRSLYRLRDANGDDQFDEIKHLKTFAGGEGHGRNQITLGPDGKVYVICGDSVEQPVDANYLPPLIPQPDDIQKTQNGFVARTDADGKEWEVVSRGLRNPYGLDFNSHGDLFTYDADAEYDMGSSWYRPTRVLHLLPGSDYGWRRVTERWPPYNPDSASIPQPMLDIGRGSPTSVEFASGDNFPAPYRDALFVLDWSYGRILAVHMQPSGSSYVGAPEVFLRGSPLNVTDLEFGRDGAMYFVTGGRKTQSGLYRVTYAGDKISAARPTEQQTSVAEHANSSRQLRTELETLLRQDSSDVVDTAWRHLDASDPWIRHAARTVIESRPVAEWHKRVHFEANIDRFLSAGLALQRFGDGADQQKQKDRLEAIDLEALLPWQQVEWTDLCLRQLASSDASDAKWDRMFSQVYGIFPANHFALDQLTGELLAKRDDGRLVSPAMNLLEQSSVIGNQRQQMHWLYILSTQSNGWTAGLRERYFTALRDMESFEAGAGMPTFRRLIREAAIANLPENEREQWMMSFDKEAAERLPDLPPARTTIVKQWALQDFRNLSSEVGQDADLARGKEMFATARCVVCHRIGAEGGVSGPDLTGVARRFSTRDLVVSIVDPSAVVSEKYANTMFELADGRVFTGRTRVTDYRSPDAEVIPDLLEPHKAISIAKHEIVQRRVSPVSPMPKGLVDGLTKAEILDLIAYLREQ